MTTESVRELCHRLDVNPDKGLSESQVMSRLVKEGGNLFSAPPRTPIYHRILVFGQKNLIFIMQVLLLLSIIRPINSEGNVSKLLHILLSLFFMGPIFYRTYSRRKEELLASVEILDSIRLLRNGLVTFVDTAHIVTGDIVYLTTDDIVPADMRVLKTESLYIDTSPITGVQEVFRATENSTLFRGYKVICGVANGVVFSVGDQTLAGQKRQQAFPESEGFQPIPLGEKLLGLLTFSIVVLGIAVAYFQTDLSILKYLVTACFISVRFYEDYASALTVVEAITKRQIEGTGLSIVKFPDAEAIRELSHICVNLDDFVKKKKKQVSRLYVNGRVVSTKELRPGEAAEVATCSVLGMAATFEINPAIKERRVIGSPEDGALLFFSEPFVDIPKLQTYKTAYHQYEKNEFQLYIRTQEISETEYSHRLACVGTPDFVLGKCEFEYVNTVRKSIDKVRLQSMIEELQQTGYSLLAVGYLDFDPKDYSLKHRFTQDTVPLEGWTLAGIYALNDELLSSFGSSLTEFRDHGFRVTAFTSGTYQSTLTYFSQLGILSKADITEGDRVKNDEITVLNGEAISVFDLANACLAVPVAVVCHLRMNDRFDLVREMSSERASIAYLSGAITDIPPLHAASISIGLTSSEDILHSNSHFTLPDPLPDTILQLKQICLSEPQRSSSTLQHLWTLYISQLCIFLLGIALNQFEPAQFIALFLELGALNAPCFTFGPVAREWSLETGFLSIFGGIYAFFSVLSDFGIPLPSLWTQNLSELSSREHQFYTPCAYEESSACYNELAFLHAQTAYFVSVIGAQWAMYTLMQLEDTWVGRKSLHWGTIHVTYFFKTTFVLIMASVPKLNAIVRLTPLHFEHFAFPGVVFAGGAYVLHFFLKKAWKILRD